MSEKTAIVIGASRGIGLGLAKELAGRGYRVIATERSESEALREAAKAHEPAIEIAKCDVTDHDSVAGLGGKLEDGSLDLLIVNAGVYGPDDQSLSAVDRDSIADIVETNAIGPIRSAQALLPLLKDGGTIGMMTSKMGSIDDSSGGANHYRVSKVVQNMLARSLFENHAKERGIAVVSQHPGWVQTDMGGENAPIDVDTSVRGIVDVLEGQSAAEHRFVAYDGAEIAW
ncbi:SDR family NAD(P)-dependent oxidoreductase [Aurantiacibacter gangjinensis]|uniref:Short-chain dehydrogenase n=1 Tax=Aurantiacibacter gangjinensis TaxID=502682 RepID=A0A0G9MLY9_9SPHN|nr:SDR family NAD(P)-dependent oxidoreductase [Aurantiacibacter gangjinensis]APE27696.1 Short-chain dehydrogenase/reductase (SDR) superfamily [Aurantiacibacter gangjinensis]KLE31705.1 short-chain dehydrogenase [Aurantiacibacter gangjinensis]